MNLVEAHNRAIMAAIYLRDLLDVLRLECRETGADPFAVLATLRGDGGLRITAGSPGTVGEFEPIHQGTVGSALAKVARDYHGGSADPPCRLQERGDEPRDQPDTWRHEVTVLPGTAEKYRASVGFLWVSEADYAAACQRIGMTEYHWPKSPGPIVAANLARRAIQSFVGPTADGFTLEEAADRVARQRGWHEGQRDTFLEQMAEAGRDGSLIVRHPHTNLPYRPNTPRMFYERVTVEDLNAWLASRDAPSRLSDGANAPEEGLEGPAPQIDGAISRQIKRADYLRQLMLDAIDVHGYNVEAILTYIGDAQQGETARSPCIVSMSDDGVVWKNYQGKVTKTTMKDLRARIKRLRPA